MLVHGLWVHGAVMLLMQRRIARAGYRVLAYSYPTVKLVTDRERATAGALLP